MTDAVETVSIGRALRRRWWLVLGTPFVTGILAILFVFKVTPVFEARGSVRFLENTGGPLGGALSALGGGGESGLSFLSGLTGQGIPISTEMTVMKSRTIAGEMVDTLGLRLELVEPARNRRSDVFSRIWIGPEAGEWVVTLLPTGSGTFRAEGEVLVGRDPFRPVMNETRELRSLGEVGPGEPLPIEGTRIVLTTGAAELGVEIEFEIHPRPVAIDAVLENLVVARPERDADVVEVLVQWTDPQVARDGVNFLTTRFVEMRDTLQATEAARSARFLSEQLDSLAGELNAAEEDLRDFREREGLAAPEAQAESGVERVGEIQVRRDLMAVEQRALRQLLDQIESGQVSAPEGESRYRRLVYFPTLLQASATGDLLNLLGELENERAELRVLRTDESPQISEINRRVADLEGQLQTVAETYLEGLENQVASLDGVLAEFRGELARVPAVEMEYLRRLREVELLTQLYMVLQASQKDAEVRAAGDAGGVRVLDIAVEPIEPVLPKPMLTGLLAVVLGGLIGVGGAVVLGHADQVASRATDPSAA